MSVRQHDIPPYPRGGGEESSAAPRRGALSGVLTAFGMLLVVGAIVVAAYPFVSSRIGAYRANQQFTAEREIASAYDEAAVDASIGRAEAYNAALAGTGASEGGASYEQQLVVDDSHVLCWLDIPSLGIKMPVFHDDGTDEVPAEGAEHVMGTSLPVGGVPSNTVITAHSGANGGTPMAFNKLDYLQAGDAIVLWTLGRPYAYVVTDSEQTDPGDVSGLHIREGAEELTLLTCRPIGTTARRLLVHAKRTDYMPSDESGERTEILADPDEVRFMAALGALGIIPALLLLLAWRRKCVWYLNRGLGAMLFSEHDLATLEGEGQSDMALELLSFGRARMRLYGQEERGSWKRDRRNRQAVILEFAQTPSDNVPFACPRQYARIGMGHVVLPCGPIEIRALDGEIAIDVNGRTSRLVFSRKKPQRQEEPRGRSEPGRR